jgi:hypothetical protein
MVSSNHAAAPGWGYAVPVRSGHVPPEQPGSSRGGATPGQEQAGCRASPSFNGPEEATCGSGGPIRTERREQ